MYAGANWILLGDVDGDTGIAQGMQTVTSGLLTPGSGTELAMARGNER
jgi:hypothetical protein